MLYKRGRVWWIRMKHKGRCIRKSTGTTSKMLAKKIELKIRNDITEHDWLGSEVIKRTLSELVDRYGSECSPKKKSSARDFSIFKHLLAFFGADTFLKDIEKSIGEYERYRYEQGAAPATIVKELGLLRRMFNIARKRWRWVKDNPVQIIEMPKVNNERVRYLNSDEYTHLFDVLELALSPRWLKPLVITALNTGLRESNILNLRWPKVNLFSRIITIEGVQMKNKESIGIPLTQEAFDTLKELQKVRLINSDLVFHDGNKRIYPVRLQRNFKKVCKIAGIEDFTFHDLRHTFASYLRQKGVDLHTISKLLGHKDTRMTQRYAHLSVENLRSAISVLNQPKGAQKGAQEA